MIESLLMAGIVWSVHAVAGGLPAIVAFLMGKLDRSTCCLWLLVLPFWALLAAQMIWPVGGMSSYLARLFGLTVAVFCAQIIAILPGMRKAPAWSHLLLLLVATLAVVPLQLLVPALSD